MPGALIQMPLSSPITLAGLSAEEFEKIDYRVMGHAYASQNELGRLCDECTYEADLKARLIADGFRSVHTQVPLTITHGDFTKTLRLDLIADQALYEFKAQTTFAADDEAQLLNYMFLLGIQRGKLLNFRPSKVQGKLIATGLTDDIRRRFVNRTGRWQDLTPGCALLKETMNKLLQDWGAFLSVGLYQEALVCLLGGAVNVEHRVGLRREGVDLGSQRMLIHSPTVAFRVTALTEGQNVIESHLRRLIALTNLKAIQWINMNHATIEFITVTP